MNDHPGHAAPDSDPAARPAKIEVHDLLKAANVPSPPKRLPAVSPPTRNEIHTILRDNTDRANAAGLNDLAPKAARRSRRQRDFWLLLVVVNAFFAFAAFGPFSSPAVRLYALAGFVIFTLGLTWVMWFVLDDY